MYFLDRKRRPLTQIIESNDVNQVFRTEFNNDSTEETISSPKFTRPVKDIQAKLKENLPEIELPKENNNNNYKLNNKQNRKKLVVNGNIDADKEDLPTSPYDKFEAKELIDRHPSVRKCFDSPKKIAASSFFTTSKLSVSSPNLTKLIQEDSIFEEERKKQALKYTSPKKKLPYNEDSNKERKPSTGLRKKLSVPVSLKSEIYGNVTEDTNNDRDLYGSEHYRNRFGSYKLTREDSAGAVHRRPEHEKRAQYPVSMAFTDSAIAAGFKPVSVEIDLDEKPDETKDQTVNSSKGKLRTETEFLYIGREVGWNKDQHYQKSKALFSVYEQIACRLRHTLS